MKKHLVIFSIGVVLIITSVLTMLSQGTKAATTYTVNWEVSKWRIASVTIGGDTTYSSGATLGPAEWTVSGTVSGVGFQEVWSVPDGGWEERATFTFNDPPCEPGGRGTCVPIATPPLSPRSSFSTGFYQPQTGTSSGFAGFRAGFLSTTSNSTGLYTVDSVNYANGHQGGTVMSEQSSSIARGTHFSYPKKWTVTGTINN